MFLSRIFELVCFVNGIVLHNSTKNNSMARHNKVSLSCPAMLSQCTKRPRRKRKQNNNDHKLKANKKERLTKQMTMSHFRFINSV